VDDLGPLEMKVLGLLRAGEPSTVAQVQQRLGSGGAELAYTTVMTVLVRLHRKGMVDRRKEGTRFVYVPAKKASRVSAGIFTRIKQALFQSDRARPIVALLDDDDLSPDDLRALRTVIDEKLQQKKRRRS
jgi:predicted transcriptional regulator